MDEIDDAGARYEVVGLTQSMTMTIVTKMSMMPPDDDDAGRRDERWECRRRYSG